MRYFLPIFLMLPFLGYSQTELSIDFTKVAAEISPVPQSKEIKGEATYDFELNSAIDSIFLDAVNIAFLYVELDGKEVSFSNSGDVLGIKAPKRNGKHRLFIRYSTKPKQTVYFMGGGPSFISKQVWTQGQGKYTSHWLPSIDDMTDKMEFDLTILTDKEKQVIANGKLIKKIARDGLIAWEFDMIKPMSSYLTAFTIGNFDKKIVHSNSGIPIELYYEPKDSLRYEPTYRYSKEIFDFLEKEIGVAYPWQNYKQVPVQDFLYAGMENTTSTIFSNQYVIDSTAFVDKNYVNVNAHELAHQWFGNLVTEASGEHHWLHEGFATYYAYLTEKQLFGDDHFYWRLYDTAKTLHSLSENGDGEALTDPKAGSLTFYEKGAWALAVLREWVGDDAFRKGIRNYLNNHSYGNVTITDFLKEIEGTSGWGLSSFREQWLENEEFPWEQAKEFLESKNSSLRTYLRVKSQKDSMAIFKERIWNDKAPIPLKRQLIFDNADKIPDSILSRMIKNEPLEVRQSIVLGTPKIPMALQSEFEGMLSDKSYVSQEALLFKLWDTFVESRSKYLDQTNEIVGLPNKNVRLLWLTLALVTPEYQPENKKIFYEELNDYTSNVHNFETRKLAFQYLHQIRALSDKSLENLLQASNHHVWQFKKSSRNLLREINESDQGKERLMQLSLDKEEKELLNTILNP